MTSSAIKQARQELTGGMPTGRYDMSEMEFTVTHKTWDRLVRELSVWPDQSYWTSWAEYIQSEAPKKPIVEATYLDYLI